MNCNKKQELAQKYEYYQQVLVEEPTNIFAKIELAKILVKQRKFKKAENILKECLEISDNKSYILLELGRLYLKQGKLETAEETLNQSILEDENNILARGEMARFLAEKYGDKEEKEFYDYIFKYVDIEYPQGNESEQDIFKHWKNDLTKDKHEVFTIGVEEVKIALRSGQMHVKHSYMVDVYFIQIKNCGYEGGFKGDGHQLDYLTVITLPQKRDIITVFPSDGIIGIKDKNKRNKNKKNREFDEER